MDHFDNEQNRFGSAGFIDLDNPALKPCCSKTPDSLFVGFMGNRPLYWNGMGGVLLVAGARGGKLTTVLAYQLLDGMYGGTVVSLDMKRELSAVSAIQTRKHCYEWNPLKDGCRINPVAYIRKDSPTVVSDTKVFCENMIALTGSANADYFERRGREFLEAIILTIVHLDGVLTLPRLYEVINLITGNSDAWLEFAFEMQESGHDISARIEEEIAQNRDKNSSGMNGILGEIFKSFACLSDPQLMASVSPPYDFCLSQLTERDKKYHLAFVVPAEFVESWGAILKALFVGAMIYKSRAPSAPRQTWILDECAQLGSFPLIPKLFSYGAGIGIRPVAVYQSTAQMNQTGPNAETIITSSAAVRIYFAIRDYPSARTLSNMLGTETLEYNDILAQSREDHARKQALQAVMGGESPMEAGLRLAHHRETMQHRSEQARLLRTPDEVLNTAGDKAYIFMDGLPLPIYGDRKPYYEQRWLAGKFLPNPYHPPLDKVRVKTLFGHAWKRVITSPVPAKYAHLPQYDDGTWSFVEGYR